MILRNLFGFEKLYGLIKYVIARKWSLKTIPTFLTVLDFRISLKENREQ